MARPRTTIEYLWAEPDPTITAQRILHLADELEDFRSPLSAAAFLVREDIKERFRTGTDSSGRPWQDWAPDPGPPTTYTEYGKWAMKHTTGPILPDRANLHLTGELEAAVLAPTEWRITGGDLFLDTSDLPPWWAWNNFGATRRNPASESDAAKGLDAWGNELPERQFIGTSVEARAKIDLAFERWFAEEVEVATSPLGKRYFRHAKRGSLGTFVPR